jgi:hypothetical protein
MVKLAAESKIRKCQCCKTGNVHILLVLISEKRLNGFGSSQKSIFYELILQVRVCRANSEGKHDKPE